MRYTINLDCKTYHIDRNGEVPILLRVSINGEHGYINTGKKIKKEYYNEENKSVKSGLKGGTKISSFIDRQKVKIDEIISDYERKDEVATIQKVKEKYAQETGKVKSKCFYDFVEKTIEWERKNTSITEGTLDGCENQLNKLKIYREKLSIYEIDKTFLEEYKSYISCFAHWDTQLNFNIKCL